MNALIAISLPAATTGYLALYVVTFAVHFVLMSYVLAGTISLLCRAETGSATAKLQRIIRDWLPFMLGLTITAGVAPLLFIQILFRDRFYTANLLLFHRWMSILPVLIVDFYLLYLIKSSWFDRRSPWQRTGIIALTTLGFVYVGISWTENHLLSLQPLEVWTAKYVSAIPFFVTIDLVPRAAIWLAAVFVIFPSLLCWQLASHRIDGEQIDARRLCSRVSLTALGLASVAQVVYVFFVAPSVRSAMLQPEGIGLIVAALLTTGGVAAAWLVERRRANSGQPPQVLVLMVATSLWVLTNSLLREVVRCVPVDLAALAERHAAAAEVGGLVAFFVFAVINAILIAYCIRLVLLHRVPVEDESAVG